MLNVIFRLEFQDHPKKNKGFKDIIKSSTSASDFLEKIKCSYPYEWATKLRGLEYAASRLHPEKEENYVPPSDETTFNVPQEIMDWCKQNVVVINPHFFMVSSITATQDQLDWIIQCTDDQLMEILKPYRDTHDQDAVVPVYTSSAQQESEKHPGPVHWGSTTTFADSSISPLIRKTRSLTSLMMSNGNTYIPSNPSSACSVTIQSTPNMGKKRRSKVVSRRLFF